MKATKLTFVVGIVLVSTSPAFSQFVKAALGFRIGHSPTESGYGKSAYNPHEKKAIGVQVLSGVNNGGWKGPLQAAASSHGDSSARSFGGGPLDAHVGNGAVKHLRILGLNLYFGGRASNNGLGHNGYAHKPIAKKPVYAVAHQPAYQQYQQYQQYQPTNYLAALSKPISLGAGVGGGVKPIVGHAPNGGKILGGQSGFRAAVGTPGFGLGFNLGYKQGINTKSPLGHIFGLGGGQNKGYYPQHAPTVHKGPIYKGQDQVYIPGSGLLKGHGHDINHSPANGGQNPFGAYPFENSVYGLESKQHANTQPLQQAASNNQNQNQAQQQSKQQHQSQQASQNHHQQASVPAKHHQGLQGPMSYPSYSRNPFIAFLQGRPSILRPTRLQYNFNSPNSPQSHPSNGYRMMHHPPTPAPQQRPQHNPLQSLPQGWSTLFPLGGGGGLHPSATNSFVNPLPANGQPLAKLQASLRPGNPFQQQHAPVTSAQNQFPFIQQARQNAQPQFQGFFSQSAPTHGHFNQQQQQLHSQPQNTFQNYFSNGFQQNQASAAPQFSQDFNPFQNTLQQSSLQSFPNFPQANFQQSPQNNQQQTPFFNSIQEQPTHESAPSTAQSKQSNPSPFPSLAEVPFNPTATPFAPESGYQYSHSTVSEPIKMGQYTMNMDLGTTGSSAEQGQGGSNQPMFGPMGRRLVKKNKKQRSDIIIKKQGTPESDIKPAQQEMLEASASSIANSVTLASSLGETAWTPLVDIDIPKIQKKSLETPVSTSLKVVDKQQPQQYHQQKINPAPSNPSAIQQEKVNIFPSGPSAIPKRKINPSPSGPSAILTGPAPALGPQEQKSDRTMILKKRRLNLSSSELLNTPTVIPAMTSSASVPTSSSTTSSAPSSSSSTTTTTTTTTTIVPPSSSSSSSAPSTSSEAPSTETASESSSQSSSSSPVTTTIVNV